MAESWEEKLQIFENLLSFFFFFSPRFLSNNGQNRNWASMFFWGEEDCSSNNNNNNNSSSRWSGENSVLTSSSLFFSAKEREKFLIPSSRVRTYLARKKKQDRHPVPSSRSVHATTGYYHFKIRDLGGLCEYRPFLAFVWSPGCQRQMIIIGGHFRGIEKGHHWTEKDRK